jgi:chromosome segregation ATPase
MTGPKAMTRDELGSKLIAALNERDELRAEVELLQADNELLQTDRNRWREMWGELDAKYWRLREHLKWVADTALEGFRGDDEASALSSINNRIRAFLAGTTLID